MIEVNDTLVHLIEQGNGQPVVLLHGWGAESGVFAPVITHLSQKYRVICPDLPGFGKSAPLRQPWRVQDYANFVEALMQKLGAERPIIIGHSYGGRVIIKLAAVNKIQFNKIMLIDSAGIRPQRSINYYTKIYTFKTCKRMLTIPLWEKHTRSALDRLRTKFGSSDYRNADPVMRATLSLAIDEDLRHHLSLIETETLLVWGSKDTATPMRDAKIMQKLLPNSGLAVFDGAGHYSFLEQLPRFLKVLDVFLGA